MSPKKTIFFKTKKSTRSAPFKLTPIQMYFQSFHSSTTNDSVRDNTLTSHISILRGKIHKIKQGALF